VPAVLNGAHVTLTISRSRRTADDLGDLDEQPSVNLKNLAHANKVEVADLVVCILDRPRHAELIAKVRESGAPDPLISTATSAGVQRRPLPSRRPHRHYFVLGACAEGVLRRLAAGWHRRAKQCRAIVRNDDSRRPRLFASGSPTSIANTNCSISPRLI